VEEPLEVRVNGTALSVTMRTPGHDIDLAHGYLVSEGVLSGPADVVEARFCAGTDETGRNLYNVLDVTLAAGVAPPAERLHRHVLTSSACGICGATSIDAVRTAARYDVAGDPVTVRAALLAALPDRLREQQPVFAQTGGLHAAGLFTADGTALLTREDVGRHNAVDKVVGAAMRDPALGLPLRGTVLLVSGRASFELVQKAVVAGVPVLAAVSAPSSLAVDLARETGLTLVGFLRGDRMNVYAGEQRVRGGPAD
jgi:FdhD protein